MNEEIEALFEKTDKLVNLICIMVLITFSLFSIYHAITNKFNQVNHCYAILHGKIEDEKGEQTCWNNQD